MDIMDIQAVESKLSDVTVTPIPRSQVQNFYNYQQQREQREQQPQIQISAIHHPPRDRHTHAASSNDREDIRGGGGHSTTGRDLYTSHHSKREREYHQQLSQIEAAVAGAGGMGANPAVTAAALQYAQQLQAQLALLQQQANTTASPSITLTPANPRAAALTSSLASSLSMTPIPNTTNTNNTSSNNVSITSNGGGGGNMVSGHTPSQLKYPQSTSPLFLSNTQAAKLVAPLNNTNSIDLQTSSSSSSNTGANNNTQNNGLTKYAQLLAVIEEMGRDIRPTYTGSRSSTERLKRGIVHARILVRECLMETERSARQ